MTGKENEPSFTPPNGDGPRHSELQYRTLVANSPLCIHEIDLNGRLISMNPAGLDMLGVQEEGEIVGLEYLECSCPADRELILPLMAAAYQGEASSFQFTGNGVDPRIFSSCFQPIREDGNVVRLMGITEDITERITTASENARLRDEMLHSQKLESLGLLAGGIAHDFNNLLVSILGNASIALNELPDDNSTRGLIEKIESASIQAADLCREMLAYAGKGKFITEPLDLRQLVNDMTQLLGIPLNKGSLVEYEFDEGLPSIEGDLAQLRQVVMNLMTNAADAVRETQGAIKITVKKQSIHSSEIAQGSDFFHSGIEGGDFVVLEVMDEGTGMSPEVRARIFDPFYSTKERGRGLGLSAVLGIVKAHAGAIYIASEPGVGSTFRVMLPASEKVILQKKPVATLSPITDYRILVIDDEQGVREVVSMMLNNAGYTVLEAFDGSNGMEILREQLEDITLIVLDMTMPGMSGSDVLHEVRKLSSDIGILLTSGQSDLDTAALISGDKNAGFLQKPYQVDALLQKVADLVTVD